MKFAVLFLAALASAAPPAVDDEKLVITDKFFPEPLAVYTGEYDIVDIVVPLNQINYDDEGITIDDAITLFFVKADIKDNGDYDYKGLYVLKGTLAKKILDNGQCSTFAKDKNAYFGAKDGIYKYNHTDQTATKFGDVTESVIKMAIDTERANVYYLTEDYVLYKYSEDETERSVVDAVKDARDIAFDFDGNLFYYDGSKQFYTYNGEKIVKVSGLPEHPKKVNLLRVPVLVNQALAVIDGVLYTFKVDGTSEKTVIEFQTLPTAFAPDTVLMEWFAYNKKIYEYNLVRLIDDKSIDALSDFFNDRDEQLNTIKTTKVSNRL